MLRYIGEQVEHPKGIDVMVNKRGRPPIDDRVALRRIAEHIVAAEDKGTRCSIRAAILRTSDRVVGNSSDAMLWRLQRKWRRDRTVLLAEARERRAMRRRTASPSVRGGLLGSAVDEFVRSLQAGRVNFGSEVQAVIGRVTRVHDEATATLRRLDQFRLATGRASEAMSVALRLQDEIGRMADFESEAIRARRPFEQLTRGW
jgi:hypothetical protein